MSCINYALAQTEALNPPKMTGALYLLNMLVGATAGLPSSCAASTPWHIDHRQVLREKTCCKNELLTIQHQPEADQAGQTRTYCSHALVWPQGSSQPCSLGPVCQCCVHFIAGFNQK